MIVIEGFLSLFSWSPKSTTTTAEFLPISFVSSGMILSLTRVFFFFSFSISRGEICFYQRFIILHGQRLFFTWPKTVVVKDLRSDFIENVWPKARSGKV